MPLDLPKEALLHYYLILDQLENINYLDDASTTSQYLTYLYQLKESVDTSIELLLLTEKSHIRLSDNSRYNPPYKFPRKTSA